MRNNAIAGDKSKIRPPWQWLLTSLGVINEDDHGRAEPVNIFQALLPFEQQPSKKRTEGGKAALRTIRCHVTAAEARKQPTNNAALSMFVQSKLFHLVHMWPMLTPTQERNVAGCSRELARITSACPCPGVIPVRFLEQMLDKIRLPPSDVAKSALAPASLLVLA